jgi:hypothetical protein
MIPSTSATLLARRRLRTMPSVRLLVHFADDDGEGWAYYVASLAYPDGCLFPAIGATGRDAIEELAGEGHLPDFVIAELLDLARRYSP